MNNDCCLSTARRSPTTVGFDQFDRCVGTGMFRALHVGIQYVIQSGRFKARDAPDFTFEILKINPLLHAANHVARLGFRVLDSGHQSLLNVIAVLI